MRRVRTSELIPGMITAEDVYNYSNQLILSKGIILNDKTITKLAFYSILNIRIEDDVPVEIQPETSHDSSYAEKIQKNPKFLKFRAEF